MFRIRETVFYLLLPRFGTLSYLLQPELNFSINFKVEQSSADILMFITLAGAIIKTALKLIEGLDNSSLIFTNYGNFTYFDIFRNKESAIVLIFSWIKLTLGNGQRSP